MSTKIASWNVNGIRAAVKKDFLKNVKKMKPDVLCLQETKAQPDEVEEALSGLKGYHLYANSADRKGYSSTAILSKDKPINVINDIGVSVHDTEGRVITAEYPDYFLVTVYVPNSGRGLPRHAYRARWDKSFRKYLKDLEKKKPVIACGDFNVAHQPIDLARPKGNYNKTAGYTQLEIDGFTKHLKAGFIDTFRHLYPEEISYTWWSYFRNMRERNVGWRIDYFLTSQSIISDVKDSIMHHDIHGSDHCPVALILY